MSSGRRRKKHEEHEEPENHERWLVTYADMLTLLMVLFIVMFAMSQVDQKKYNALKTGLAEGFGAESSFTKGTDSILDGEDIDAGPNLIESQVFESLPAEQQQLVKDAVNAAEQQRQQRAAADAEAEANKLKAIQARIERAMARKGYADDIQTTIDARGLVVSLVSRHVVFRPDLASLSPRGQAVVDVLTPVLRGLSNALRIDGHTNQEPVHPRYYATDWDLSAARAVTVLRRLNEVGDIPAGRLSLSAFGHEAPLVDPSKPGSQRVNKRVDIVVLPSTTNESDQVVQQVQDVRTSRQGVDG
ncbi:flagellar motor protein MotB [Nocardioides sp. CN2-186]|uniref:flagellar motor protein MotB n=1 Tax=Nocardioides tweenelious TaxID=3156607 RepID=UPI0032B3FA00